MSEEEQKHVTQAERHVQATSIDDMEDKEKVLATQWFDSPAWGGV